MSFREIADIPFDAYMAALDSWQLTGHRGELRLGHRLLRGPAERGSPLRYHADRGALGLRAAAPSGADAARDRALVAHRHRPRTHPVPTGEAERSLLRGGHRLLDSLTRPLPVRVAVQQRPDQDYRCAAVS